MDLSSEYQEVPPKALLASKYLVESWEKLGKPQTPLTESGKKMMAVIVAAWEELYPIDAKTWTNEMISYKSTELSIKDQVHKHTGRSLASIPLPVYLMMEKIFPTYKLEKREEWLKFLKKYPEFRAANKL